MTYKLPQKKNIFLFCLTLCLLLLGANNVFAVDAQEFRSDASTTFLSVIFGGVSKAYTDVLGGGAPNLLGTVFEYFNNFIAVVGVVIVTYITVVAIMNSAHSGTPMGQKWHTLFLPMRVTVGAGLLIPNAFGYNLAQVVIMWFILTGINAADYVWDKILDRLSIEGQSSFLADTQVEPDNILAYYGDTIRFSTCVGSAAVRSDYPPTTGSANYNIECVSGSTVVNQCSEANGLRPADPAIASNCGTLSLSRGRISDDSNWGRFILELLSAVITPIVDDIRIGTNTNAALSSDQYNNIGYNAWLNINYGMSLVQNAILTEELINLSSSRSQDTSIDKRIGWIAAGAEYYKRINSGSGISGSTNYNSIVSSIGAPRLNQGVVSSISSSTLESAIRQNFPPDLSLSGADALQDIKFEPSRDSNLFWTIISLGFDKLIEFVVKNMLAPHKLFGYDGPVNLFDPQSVRDAIKVDPIKGLASAGSNLTNNIEHFVSITLLVGAAVSIATAFLPGLPYFLPHLGIIVPVVLGVLFGIVAMLMLFYPIGIIMNLYVPLIPFIVFLFGVVGWLLICVEAMAAGPIVAIGLMHPDGNEVLGKAEQGLMLILNLMLRPVLMILGLMAAIVVVRIVILIFSWGMNILIGSGLMPIQSVGAYAGLLFFYVMFLTTLIQKSFSLINQVPDKLLIWIGGSGGGVGDSGEFLQGARQNVEQGGKLASDTAEAGKKGFSAGKTLGSNVTSSKPPGGGGGSIG